MSEKEYFICPNCDTIHLIKKSELKTKRWVDVMLYLQEHHQTVTSTELANLFYFSKRRAQQYIREYNQNHNPEYAGKKEPKERPNRPLSNTWLKKPIIVSKGGN